MCYSRCGTIKEERLVPDRDGLGEKPERENTRWKDPWLTEEDQGGAGAQLKQTSEESLVEWKGEQASFVGQECQGCAEENSAVGEERSVGTERSAVNEKPV